eukprot:17029-Heterococcus_DN1.PRE.5
MCFKVAHAPWPHTSREQCCCSCATGSTTTYIQVMSTAKDCCVSDFLFSARTLSIESSGSRKLSGHTFCLSATDAVSVRSPIACSTDPSDAASLSALASCYVYDDPHCNQ